MLIFYYHLCADPRLILPQLYYTLLSFLQSAPRSYFRYDVGMTKGSSERELNGGDRIEEICMFWMVMGA